MCEECVCEPLLCLNDLRYLVVNYSTCIYKKSGTVCEYIFISILNNDLVKSNDQHRLPSASCRVTFHKEHIGINK